MKLHTKIVSSISLLLIPTLVSLASNPKYFDAKTTFGTAFILIILTTLSDLKLFVRLFLIELKSIYLLLLMLFLFYYTIVILLTDQSSNSIFNILINTFFILFSTINIIPMIFDLNKDSKKSFHLAFLINASLMLPLLLNLFSFFVLKQTSNVIETSESNSDLFLSFILNQYLNIDLNVFRISFPYANPVTFGKMSSLLLVCSIFLIFNLSKQSFKSSHKLIYFFALITFLITGIVCLIYSDTRSSYISIAMAFGVLFFVEIEVLRNKTLFLMIKCIIIGLPVIIPTFGSNFINDLEILSRGHSSSSSISVLSSRELVWDETMRIIVNSDFMAIIFGHGRQLLEKSPTIRSLLKAWKTPVISAHNTFLENFFSYGIPGLLYYFLLYTILINHILKFYYIKNLRPFFAVIIVYLGLGISDATNLFYIDATYMPILVCVLIVARLSGHDFMRMSDNFVPKAAIIYSSPK